MGFLYHRYPVIFLFWRVIVEEKKKIIIYDVIKQLKIKQEDEENFKARFFNMIPYHIYDKEDEQELLIAYVKKHWDDYIGKLGYEFNEKILDSYILEHMRFYIHLSNHGSVSKLPLQELEQVLMDQAIRLWIIENDDYESYRDFNRFYDWMDLFCFNRNFMYKCFKTYGRIYLYKGEDYQIVKNIFSNNHHLNRTLYNEAKVEFLNRALSRKKNKENSDFQSQLEKHYLRLVVENEQLKMDHKLMTQKTHEYHESLNEQEFNLYESLLNDIENKKYNYPLSKMIKIIGNVEQMDAKFILNILSKFIIALNNHGIQTEIPMTDQDPLIECYGWKIREELMVESMRKGD
jgi:hypothetical protein